LDGIVVFSLMVEVAFFLFHSWFFVKSGGILTADLAPENADGGLRRRPPLFHERFLIRRGFRRSRAGENPTKIPEEPFLQFAVRCSLYFRGVICRRARGTRGAGEFPCHRWATPFVFRAIFDGKISLSPSVASVSLSST
jgi:hypothetical protein